ncbi:restless-like transposase [Apiospora kogelbergensis]|uniref:Restless-like transposase n=1 Tax=Apiospora kogelbergensis TaxID=1337665 RepID=A0AAW0QMD6_9PEZI
MIRRALELRDCLDILVIKYKAQFIEENISKRTHQLRKSATLPRTCKDENLLSSQDCETLQHVYTFLGFHEDAVKVLEVLVGQVEDGKIAAENFPGSEHFKFGINNAWMKLDSCYNMLDETPIYYAALALHPAFRWRWFEKQWKSRPDWVNNAKRKVQEVWDHEYRDREDGLTRVVPAKGAREEPPRKRQRLYLNGFQQFSEGGRERPTSQDSSENDDPYDSFDFDDEYEVWQQTKDKTDQNPIPAALSNGIGFSHGTVDVGGV